MAMNNIARRLEGEKVPFLDLMAEHDSLINRIRRLFGG
jgi:septum site-determining protein MinD